MNTINFYKYSVTAILFMLFLTPTIYIPGFIGVRLEEIYILFFALVVLSVSKENGWSFKVPLRALLLLIFWLIMLISTFYGSLLLLPATLGDLSKVVWLIKAVVIYAIFYNYINLERSTSNARIDFVLRYFVKFAVVSAFICFQQYFDIFGLNSLYVPIIAPTQYLPLMPGYPSPRVMGMLGNPNVQGYVLALAIVVWLYMCMKEKISIFSLIILFVALLMTLSRGALVALVVGGVTLFISYKKDTHFALVKTLVGVGLLLLFYLAYQWMLENEAIYNAVMFRFEMLENPAEDESFVARYDAWMNNVRYFSISPIVGVGLLPRETSIGADNEWLLFLRSFGIVGIVWLITFMFAPIILKKNNSSESKNQSRFVFSLLLLCATFMIPAVVILSPVTSPFLLVLLSISDRTVFTINYRVAKQPLAKIDGLNAMRGSK